jgi:hypothetical protein
VNAIEAFQLSCEGTSCPNPKEETDGFIFPSQPKTSKEQTAMSMK